MKDTELQKIVLQSYYDLRDLGLFQWITEEVPEDKWPPVESFSQLARISSQLAEEDLIEWRPLIGGNGQVGGGSGRIKARGVRVIEGTEEPPVGFVINNIHNPANVQVGNHNSISTVINVERFNAAIDHSSFSVAKKAEAKSALSKFLEHPVIAAILGGLASTVKRHKRFFRRECGPGVNSEKPNKIGADRIERVDEWRQGRRASVLECASPLALWRV